MFFERTEITSAKRRDSDEHMTRDSELDEQSGERSLISRRLHATWDDMRGEVERTDFTGQEGLESGGGGYE